MKNQITVVVALDGRVIHTEQQGVFRRSNKQNKLVALLNFPSESIVKVNFIRPDGVKPNSQYMTYIGAQDYESETYSAYSYMLTDYQLNSTGPLVVSLDISCGNATATSGDFTIDVEASESGKDDVAPTDPNQYDEVLKGLMQTDARLIDRTENVPNLVARIQKVEDSNNAFTYTDNSGVVSAPIILGDPYAAPIPVNAASAIEIPDTAWQPTYAEDNTTVTGYTYLLTSAMHGQMRDGATARDLWVSFDEAVTGGFKGATGDYTVNEAGDITIAVNQPVAMTVRVWNGKGLADKVARDDIAAETQRAEQAEQAIRTDMNAADSNLQEQINELVNTGIDTVARAAIAAETERAESAESELQQDLNTAQEQLQGQINTIDSYIPSSTTTENQLADKAFVNSSLNSMAAFYITYTQGSGTKFGQAFPTAASLLNATTFYSGKDVRVPTQNDYATVLADETQPKGVDDTYPTTRYSYQGGTYPNGQWAFQYIVNNTSLTQEQVNAINSGITKEIVDQIVEGSVTGVKGNAESVYRTGNVNLTPENIGLGNVANELQFSESNPQPTVAKLTTARNIDGIIFDGSSEVNHYGVCSTPSDTVEKTVAIENFVLVTGAQIVVKFSNANTTLQPTLNVNNTGAVPITRNINVTDFAWKSEDVVSFVYMGTSWLMLSGYSLEGKLIGSIYITLKDDPAAIFGGQWGKLLGYFGTPSTYSNQSDYINVASNATTTLNSISIPSNTMAFISGYVQANVSEPNGIMSSILAPRLQEGITTRTTMDSGGGCITNMVVFNDSVLSKTIDLKTYNYRSTVTPFKGILQVIMFKLRDAWKRNA